MFSNNRLFWIAALVGLVVDRLSKFLILFLFTLPLPPPETPKEELEKFTQELVPLIPGVFHLTYALNKGAAFSLFSNGVGWLRWLSFAVSIALLLVAWFGPRLSRWEQVGYGLILSGALGNGIDRFLWGYVVDFLNFNLIRFPIFNLADTFINIGLACLLIAAFQHPPRSTDGKESS
ncbi:MAG: lipoprotein signal peptidase [Oscillatoriales cyanobacterium C42_A2020_001]|nr:lipoprotein signal peptidase [Leptolyngbyaceae cyanobacterium C42_A2020_001]